MSEISESGTVLITGSSKGLGKELALVFANNGHDIILHGRNVHSLETIKETISEIGVGCHISYGDLRSNKTVDKLYRLAKENDISILINNAGTNAKLQDDRCDVKLHLNEISDEQIEDVLLTNLVMLIKLSKRIYTLFLDKGNGTIVNINSLSGLYFQELKSIYCASKWGLRGFTNTFRLEAEKHNIRVLDIYPGRIRTKPCFTYGFETIKVAQDIYNTYKNTDTNELILDGRLS